MDAEERPPGTRRAHQVVGRWLARRQHHHLGEGLKIVKPSRGRLETIGGTGRAND